MQQPPLVLTSGRIVKLKTKELGQSEVNCVKHLEHSYDSFFRVRKLGPFQDHWVLSC